jgi:hypothetical protein
MDGKPRIEVELKPPSLFHLKIESELKPPR